MPVLSDRVGTFTDSVIRRMTRINNQYDSINLSQGFPDFDPPKQLLDALAETAYKGPHQYAVTFGAQNFREALAKKTSPALHHEVDPNTEICVTCGGTEAMMAAMMTIWPDRPAGQWLRPGRDPGLLRLRKEARVRHH